MMGEFHGDTFPFSVDLSPTRGREEVCGISKMPSLFRNTALPSQYLFVLVEFDKY